MSIGNRAVGVAQADAGGVDHDVGVGGNLKISLPRDERRRDVNFVREQPGQLFPSAQRAVDHGDLSRAGQSQFDADRPGRPASPQQHDGLAGRIGDFAKRLDESLAVGVFADQLRAQRAGRN